MICGLQRKIRRRKRQMNKKKLIITLKSDLCVGSGYSYAGIIDSDVCYDAYGIPYIPAKRLKGILREAAEFICASPEEREEEKINDTLPEAEKMVYIWPEDIDKLFGVNGKSIYEDGKYSYTGIRLHNAYIENYKDVYESLDSLNNRFKEYVTPQSVLEQFTIVKTQTKIDSQDGTAQDQSLRSTRAVKHYSPFDSEKEMVFVGEVELLGLNEEDAKKLDQIVKAVRNIGLNRNRGMGSVRCTLQELLNKKNNNDSVEKKEPYVDITAIDDTEELYKLSYCVRNTAPLVFNVGSNYETERYIPGQSVLGYFAAGYLKSGREADETFHELFLRNKMTFSSLYPCEGEKVFYPAPSFIKCLKRTKKYVDASNEKLFKEEGELRGTESLNNNAVEMQYTTANGNMPKKLKSKFVHISDSDKSSNLEAQSSNEEKKANIEDSGKLKNKTDYEIQVKEIETDIVYHHTKKSDRQESTDGELLYSFEAIRAQQTFSGTIIGKGKYLRTIAELMNENTLQFGKSKNAQYGTCVLESVPNIKKIGDKKRIYEAGSTILVTLQSDGIFLNENGYTVQCGFVRNTIAEALKKYIIKDDTKDAVQYESCVKSEDAYSEIESRKLVGFYSKWNLKRQAIPVVCAGSSFEFKLTESIEIEEDMLYVGERNGEGFGKLSIVKKDAKKYCIAEFEKNKAKDMDLSGAADLYKQILLSRMQELLNSKALRTEIRIKNSTTVGRITLMLTESINKHTDNMTAAYHCFVQKIKSIKDKEKQETILAVKDELICKGNELKYDSLCYKSELEPLIAMYNEIQHNQQCDDIKREVENMWAEYFMNYLIHEKYKHGERKA